MCRTAIGRAHARLCLCLSSQYEAISDGGGEVRVVVGLCYAARLPDGLLLMRWFAHTALWWSWILAVGAACGSGSTGSAPAPTGVDAASWSRWQSCVGDAVCKSGVLADVLRSDATVASLLVQSEATPEARWPLVAAVIRADPARAGNLCAVVGDAALQERCRQQTSRPHLYARPPDPRTQPGARKAPGPHSSTLVLRLKSRSEYWDITPSADGCPPGATQTLCLHRVSGRYARESKADEAAAACMAIPPSDKWRGECAFQAAEAYVARAPVDQVHKAIELCWLSSEWAGRCVDKVHNAFAQRVPYAHAGADDWAPVNQAWHSMSMSWARQGESLQGIAEGAFWSTMLMSSYRLVGTPTGAPLDHLPEAAHPHVRAAAAWSMLRASPKGTPNLAETTEALKAVLASRPSGTPSAPLPHRHDAPKGDYWQVDEGDDIHLPATKLFGFSRRVLAPDLEDDLQICILEAAARSASAWWPLIEEARSSSAPMVATTANRLSRALQKQQQQQQRQNPPPRR